MSYELFGLFVTELNVLIGNYMGKYVYSGIN